MQFGLLVEPHIIIIVYKYYVSNYILEYTPVFGIHLEWSVLHSYPVVIASKEYNIYIYILKERKVHNIS